MSQDDDFSDLEARAEGLGDTLAQTSVMVSGFDSELQRMRQSLGATGKDVAALERSLSRGLRQAFDGVVFGGMNLSDALNTVASSMINATYNSAMKPVTDHFAGVITQGDGRADAGDLALCRWRGL